MVGSLFVSLPIASFHDFADFEVLAGSIFVVLLICRGPILVDLPVCPGAIMGGVAMDLTGSVARGWLGVLGYMLGYSTAASHGFLGDVVILM